LEAVKSNVSPVQDAIDSQTVRRGKNAPLTITLDEIAAELQMSYSTVYRMATAGQIPSVRKYGAQYRGHRQTVIEWLTSPQNGTPQ
jgi:excisionase family DNA binding protein